MHNIRKTITKITAHTCLIFVHVLYNLFGFHKLYFMWVIRFYTVQTIIDKFTKFRILHTFNKI